MKKQLQLLVAAALALVSVQAMAQTKTIGKANNDQPVMPKPVLTVEYDVPIETIFDDEYVFYPTPLIYANWDMHYDTKIVTETGRVVDVFMSGYTEEEVTEGEETKTKSKIYLKVSDVDYLYPNEKFTLYMPAFNGQPNGESFEYQVMDCNDIKESTTLKLIDYNKPLVIREGAEVTISGSISCTQMVVGPKSGIRINEGASLVVSDTAYFVGPQDHSYDYPWLINRGTFINGDRTVFSRWMEMDGARNSEYIHFPIALPIESTVLGEMTTYYDYSSAIKINVEQDMDELDATFQINDTDYDYEYNNIELSSDGKYQGLIVSVYDYNYSEYPGERYRSESSIRLKGRINDWESFKDEVKGTKVTNLRSGLSLCKNSLDNHYQAPINLRKVVDEQRTDFNSIYIAAPYVNKYSAYNAFSGITTYDGPMQMGYLLPHISSGLVSANTSAYLNEEKDDLTSFNEMKEKYNEASEKSPYQYIRFYVQDMTEGSYYYGKRDVCAVYFIPQEEYDQIDDRNDVGNSKKYESQVTVRFTNSDNSYENAEGTFSFPYINSKGNINMMDDQTPDSFREMYAKELGLQIKVLPIPTEDNDQELVLQLIGNQSATKMKLGILDFNLQTIGFADNNILGEPIVLHKEDQQVEYSLEGDDVDTKRKYATMAACKIKDVNLTFRVMEKSNIVSPEEEKPGTGTDIDCNKANTTHIFSVGSKTIVEGAQIGSRCEVKDIKGAVIAQKTIDSEREELHISRKGIYFVTIVNESGTRSSKVLVD